MKDSTREIFENLIKRYPSLVVCQNEIIEATSLLVEIYNEGNKLLVCGNGGSAADSLHIAGELMKSFKKKRSISPSLKEALADDYLADHLEIGLSTIALVGEIGLITAYSNDQTPDLVFAQQVLGYGKTNDVLLCISTSGNSKNCVYAAKTAKALNMKVITLTGDNLCSLDEYSDIIIHSPSKETFEIQELHLPIYHAICLGIEEEMFGE
jgi:D-sedoheptulose 7-phosphate isomerase